MAATKVGAATPPEPESAPRPATAVPAPGGVLKPTGVQRLNSPTDAPAVREKNAQAIRPEPAPRAGAGAGAGAVATAEDLLLLLETADADLRTLQAQVVYDRTFAIQGDRQVRIGRLYFESADGAARGAGDNAERTSRARRFAIEFERLLVGDREENVAGAKRSYIFDGEWLVEKDPSSKLFMKRQIAPPGQPFDALRIGEGPMPIPIGQRRADILARFDATLLPPDDGLDDDGLKSFVKDSVQLKLVPKAERMKLEKFVEIRLWYRRAEQLAGKPYLPRMAKTINQDEDESVVRLIDVKLNSELPKGVISVAEPPKDAGWEVKVEAYRGE
ncbi:MAG: hypothetical protein SFZ23_06450 [Planctomycetota bacterium]|nr:hypothetical protein [Planctomycetota bacterium]